MGQKLKKLRDDGEPERVVLFSRFSSAPVWDYKFFELFGTPNLVGYGDTCFNVVSRSSQAILSFGGPAIGAMLNASLSRPILELA